MYVMNGGKPLMVGFILTQTSLLPLARTPSSRLANSESLQENLTSSNSFILVSNNNDKEC